MTRIGIIGGSGLDDPQILKDAHETEVMTPFGPPASPLTAGRIDGAEVVILARHGRRHQFSPTQVNYRANIHALKDAGVSHILATSACGSLRAHIGRGDLVFIDQFIDFTRHRVNTFADSFENGACHTAMAEPFDAALRRTLYRVSTELGYRSHDKGTMVTIEGPRFSTRAESIMFRSWGGDVINMSVATEAALANEAGIPYAVVAMSTDYDSWNVDEEPVTWDEILAVFNENASKVKSLLVKAIPAIATQP
ncbi:MAG: S-methyl-5'-thioadenosine phosphorylase [Pseudomonadota bacterium]